MRKLDFNLVLDVLPEGLLRQDYRGASARERWARVDAFKVAHLDAVAEHTVVAPRELPLALARDLLDTDDGLRHRPECSRSRGRCRRRGREWSRNRGPELSGRRVVLIEHDFERVGASRQFGAELVAVRAEYDTASLVRAFTQEVRSCVIARERERYPAAREDVEPVEVSRTTGVVRGA